MAEEKKEKIVVLCASAVNNTDSEKWKFLYFQVRIFRLTKKPEDEYSPPGFAKWRVDI
ncbi:MAG: hypothetical protein JRD04_08630 [Deltaproteobacteria bacterium]|nr:hypothetical protein [Deltaproteobacteria bacterium]